MGNVRVEWVPVQTWNLGLFGFDHLLLTYEPLSGIDQTNWYGIEGSRVPALGSPGMVLGVLGAGGTTRLDVLNIETNGNIPDSARLIELIGTPEARGSRIVPLSDPDGAWSIMGDYAGQIESQFFPYTASVLPFSANAALTSTSLVASLLHYAGASLDNSLPFNVGFLPGRKTLLGTGSDDDLQIENGFTAIYGGSGGDTFSGTDDLSSVERFYGGSGDDTINWSKGGHVYHGGQLNMTYAKDGIDTVVYDDVGPFYVRAPAVEHIPHFNARWVVEHATGEDWLISIERLEWRAKNDFIKLGPGVDLIEEGIDLNLGTETSATPQDDRGDVLDLSEVDTGLLINAAETDTVFVQSAPSNKYGLWVEEAEWIVGSSGDDKIYLSANMRGSEGGDGNDLIDGRLATAGSGTTADGETARLEGGAGDDTIVSTTGKTLAIGGAGADNFILSSITGRTEAQGDVEFIIEGADADDRLFIPYSFLDGQNGSFDGSDLLPVLGALGNYTDMTNNGDILRFEWRHEDDYFYGHDQTDGVIHFEGSIEFTVDSNDLLINVYQAQPFDIPFINAQGQVEYIDTVLAILDETETVIRVKDFSEGDLGIQFHDYGQATTVDLGDGRSATSYANFDNAVNILTNNGNLTAPLELRPTAPSSNPNHDDQQTNDPLIAQGTGQNDVLTAANSQPHDIFGGDGDDSLSGGSGDDTLDGGNGTDALDGGDGNDSYVVDNVSDTVTELADAGIDQVTSSVDFTAPANVENITLTGDATSATGNTLANLIIGNDTANTLNGGSGDDTLIGQLGDDTLNGGDGSDTYVYVRGTGDDIVQDTGSGTNDADTLYLSGYAASDVTVVRQSSSADDLILQLAGGGKVTVEDYFLNSTNGIETVMFDTDTDLTRAEIDTLAAAAGLTTNSAPQAADDGNLAIKGHDIIIPALALLENDSDIDGDTLTISAVATPSLGTATLLPSGDIQLTVPVGTEEIVSFAYTVSDPSGATSSATAEFLVSPENLSPAANNDGPYHLAAATTATIATQNLLNNDSDPDGNTLQIVSVSNAVGGTVTLNPDDTITFTPTSGYTGPASFDYTIEDTYLATSTATVNLVVEAVTVISGTANNDTINGTAGWDDISSGDGSDTVYGNDGSDLIDGGQSNDTLYGGNGDDTLIGGNNGDTLYGDAGSDTLDGGSGVDTLDGGDGNDYLFGGKSGDTILGGAGLDFIMGGDGADTISGGADADEIDGGSGYDDIDADDGNDIVFGGGGYDDIDGGTGNDELHGDGGNDTLNGGDGIDVIFGGTGSDTIVGGTGNDLLFGDGGGDTYVLSAGDGHDIVYDFEAGVSGSDKIDVSAFGLTTLSAITDLAIETQTDAGDATVITIDADTSVSLIGVAIADLSGGDFVYATT
ncbi:MAG: Ig-like domain-containing protein [Filomicrobium sp.]